MIIGSLLRSDKCNAKRHGKQMECNAIQMKCDANGERNAMQNEMQRYAINSKVESEWNATQNGMHRNAKQHAELRAITAQSPAKSRHDRSVIVAQLSHNHSRSNRFCIAPQSLRHHYKIATQSLHNRFAIDA
jgi:hypothetical protein